MKLKKRAIITSLLTIATITLTTVSMLKSNNFDLFLIIALTIISFLVLYKFLDYIANFKTLEGKSRIDIIFLFIFFIWLFIPMSHITKDEYCPLERRPRNEWENLFQNKKINYEFGKNFSNWFDDRFFLRDDLINLYNKISLLLSKKNSKGVIDRDWILRYDEATANSIESDYRQLVNLKNFCDKNHIKLYVLIVPNRTDIYVSKRLNIRNNNTLKSCMKNINNYRDSESVNIIFPQVELDKNKDKIYMFYKTDHHWTHDGAYIGYLELMKNIRNDFLNVKNIDINDYKIYYDTLVMMSNFKHPMKQGTSCKTLGLSKRKSEKFHKTPYRYFEHKKSNYLKRKIVEDYQQRYVEYDYPFGQNLKLLCLGTSQSENLCNFLCYTFRYTKHIRTNCVEGIDEIEEYKIMKYYTKDILNYKPDILVFCITQSGMKYLHNLFEE